MTYLSSVFNDSSIVKNSFIDGSLRNAFIGDRTYPKSVTYDVYGDSPEDSVRFTVALDGKYRKVEGFFGINRSEKRCEGSPEASLRIEDDSNAPIWDSDERGGPATITQERPVKTSVAGLGTVTFIPSVNAPADCLERNQPIRVSFGRFRFIE